MAKKQSELLAEIAQLKESLEQRKQVLEMESGRLQNLRTAADGVMNNISSVYCTVQKMERECSNTTLQLALGAVAARLINARDAMHESVRQTYR